MTIAPHPFGSDPNSPAGCDTGRCLHPIIGMAAEDRRLASVIGAIMGDILGVPYEFAAWTKTDAGKSKPFGMPMKARDSMPWSDDTVCTVAIGRALATGMDAGDALRQAFQRHPNAGYGGRFIAWASGQADAPTDSWGNGAAMRISPVAAWAHTVEEIGDLVEDACRPTHQHQRSIEPSRLIATAIHRLGSSRTPELCWPMVMAAASSANLDVDTPILDRRQRGFDVSCDGTVADAIRCVHEAGSTSTLPKGMHPLERTARLAIARGGDADTTAAIACSVAAARWGLTRRMMGWTMSLIDDGESADLQAFAGAWASRQRSRPTVLDPGGS